MLNYRRVTKRFPLKFSDVLNKVTLWQDHDHRDMTVLVHPRELVDREMARMGELCWCMTNERSAMALKTVERRLGGSPPVIKRGNGTLPFII